MRTSFLWILFASMFMWLLAGCEESVPTHLQAVKERGTLIVGTRHAGTTYYQGPEGPLGLEYDLALGFAKHLGVALEIRVPQRFPDLLDQVRKAEIDFAAAGLSITPRRKRELSFGPGYQEIRPQLIYRKGTKKPRKLEDLRNGYLEIVADTSHEELLRRLRQNGYPNLAWKAHADVESETLMQWVQEELIDYTIADSNEIQVARRFYPELRIGFDLGKPETLAWAFPKDEDDSLRKEVEKYFKGIQKSGEFKRLKERYYGHLNKFSPVNTKTFNRHVLTRLPKYQTAFEQYAADQNLDWKLLAAIGYQESRWDPKAISPTGVKGLMMLTKDTAKQVGIADRKDPIQSIEGGAKYLVLVKKKIPERIPEPDRTWFALASYNVGFGHLEDARKLAQAAGLNADRWLNVRKWLPKLSDKKWHTKTRYGYARGREPVVYVDRIRRYYDLLTRYVQDQNKPPSVIPGKPKYLEITPAPL